MKSLACASPVFAVAIVALASGFSTFAQAQSQSPLGTIADKGGIFIDGKTFNILPGRVPP